MQSFKQVWSVVAKKLTYNVNFAALLLLQKAPKNNYLYICIDLRCFCTGTMFTAIYRTLPRTVPWFTDYRVPIIHGAVWLRQWWKTTVID